MNQLPTFSIVTISSDFGILELHKQACFDNFRDDTNDALGSFGMFYSLLSEKEWFGDFCWQHG